MSRFAGLREAASSAAAPAGAEGGAQARDGQMKGAEPALKTG